ncbi:MAG: hypothetical protein IJ237_04395 [Oscillospiraceae bacterium]|nr:hypothetical protein [Oscillospiraceae bacterium]
MFKLYDIRTKRQNLTQEDVDCLLGAVAKYYKESVGVESVFLGRDARIYCAEMMDRALEIFPQYGLDVYFNPVPMGTCQFYYSCMKNRDSGGVMLTASHNPKDYIGLKLVGKDVCPIAMGCGPDGGLEQVKRNYEARAGAPAAYRRGAIHIAQYQREYVEYSMKLAGVKPGDLAGLRIFGEFLSGTGGMDFAVAMDLAGADLTLSHSVPNGLFLQGDPNPIEEETMSPVREIMKKGKFDLGFCFDGDGDRMDLMFPDGSQIIPGLNMSLLVPYIRQIFSPYFGSVTALKAYVDVKAIPLALVEISRAGLEQHIIRNGHSFIKEKLQEHFAEGFVVSEEESAHYYMNFPYDPADTGKGFAPVENTLFFALLTAKALKENPAGYQRLFELQKGIYRYREWPITFSPGHEAEMEQIMAEVETLMRTCGATVIRDMDDGSDLDATLMRFCLPEHITAETEFPELWCQVAQRISRSEDGMCRWEVVASGEALCKEINDLILSITDRYVKKGIAHY